MNKAIDCSFSVHASTNVQEKPRCIWELFFCKGKPAQFLLALGVAKKSNPLVVTVYMREVLI